MMFVTFHACITNSGIVVGGKSGRHGCVDLENRGSCGHVDVRADMSPYGDRYLIENCDGRTDNYSLPPHLSPLRSFLTKVKTDFSTTQWIFGTVGEV